MAIGIPLAGTAGLVLVAALFQIFFGAIVATLWGTFGISATVVALFSLNVNRPWMRGIERASNGRVFVITVVMWGISWAIATVAFASVSLTIYPGDSVAYALSLLVSSSFGMAIFFLAYVACTALSLTRIRVRVPRGGA